MMIMLFIVAVDIHLLWFSFESCFNTHSFTSLFQGDRIHSTLKRTLVYKF